MKCPKIKKKMATGGFVTPEDQRAWVLANFPDKVASYDAMKTGQEKADFFNALYTPRALTKEKAALATAGINKPVGNETVANTQAQNQELGNGITKGISTVGQIAGLVANGASAGTKLASTAGSVAKGAGYAGAFYALGSAVGGGLKKQDEYGVNNSTAAEGLGSMLHPQEDLTELVTGKFTTADAVQLLAPVAGVSGIVRNEQRKKDKKKIQSAYEQQVKGAEAQAGAELGTNIASYNMKNGGKVKVPKYKKNKHMALGMAKGGPIVGPGTAKSDSIEDKKIPDGSFVVPAENADKAEALRTMFLGGPAPAAKLKSGGNISVSNGEHIFSPAEVALLQSKGINLSLLAPEAEVSNALANGGTPANGKIDKSVIEQYLDNPKVKNYLRFLGYMENDKQDQLSGKTQIKKADGTVASSAFGKYQFTEGTSNSLKKKYGIDVKKKEHKEQDLGALALIMERGALGHILTGNYPEASKKLKDEWPSVYGDVQKQSEKKIKAGEMMLLEGDKQIRAGKSIDTDYHSFIDNKKTMKKAPVIKPVLTKDSATEKISDPELSKHLTELKSKGANQDQLNAYKENYQQNWHAYSENGTGELQTKKEMLDLAISDLSNKKDEGYRTLVKHNNPKAKVPGSTIDTDAPLRDYKINAKPKSPVDMSGQRSQYNNEDPNHETTDIVPAQSRNNFTPKSQPLTGNVYDPKTNQISQPPLTADIIDLPGPVIQTPVVPKSNQVNVMEALGGSSGLLALAQTGFGLASTLTQKRPVGVVSPELLEGKKDAIATQAEAEAAAKYGLSPENMSQASNAISTNRATDYAEIDASTGNTSAGYGLKRVSSLNAGKNLVDLAVANEAAKMEKKRYANSLKQPIDSFRKDIATEQRNLFLDKLNGYMQRQSAGGELIGAGVKNYLEAKNSAEYNKKRMLLEEKYNS